MAKLMKFDEIINGKRSKGFDLKKKQKENFKNSSERKSEKRMPKMI